MKPGTNPAQVHRLGDRNQVEMLTGYVDPGETCIADPNPDVA
jgi:hypothetical protein